MMIAEQQQSGSIRMEESNDKDKKKKRRSNRRSKNNSTLPACNDVASPCQLAPECSPNGSGRGSCSSSKQHDPKKASGVAFNSLPIMHSSDQEAKMDAGEKVFSKSCPTPVPFEGSDALLENWEYIPQPLVEGYSQQKCFDPYWSPEAVNEALQRGEAFQATFRVNAHNRLEAYCTIEGVPTDILISGIPMQNRAVEGDIVAVKVDPPVLWARMKGSTGSTNNASSTDDRNLHLDGTDSIDRSRHKGKNKVDSESSHIPFGNCVSRGEKGFYDADTVVCNGATYPEAAGPSDYSRVNGFYLPSIDPSPESCYSGQREIIDSINKLCNDVASFPSKRPTGRVVAVIKPSPRRKTVVGFLNVKRWLYCADNCKDNRKNRNLSPGSTPEYIQLTPTDPKFPKMMVAVERLPGHIQKRLDGGDLTMEMELVAACIEEWPEESLVPLACVMQSFGRGGEMEPQIAAILFENAIYSPDFSSESLSCLPHHSWKVSQVELESRKDIRNICVFTIDPSTATDLDDALSVEKLPGDLYRVGIHIADVSYFVQPDTALDEEAQARSTSVYMLQRKLPMLPPLLSENLGSLIPGADRLTFSIFWDIDLYGNVIDRWIGRTVIQSCCKLSYEHAQDIIDGRMDVNSLDMERNGFPKLYGRFGWHDVVKAVRNLHEISKTLKENRFNDGAIRLENAKVAFLLDECGVPYDSLLSGQKDSNFLVEEFMLLANRTAAEIISRAFPDSALLRRHPEPNMRKLKDFEAFCFKHGLELDASSSKNFHCSLERIREKLKDDSGLYDILINYATKPMQLAKYFCSGDVSVSENEWGHYALAVPLYTHFTSPLRRYPDIVVHRTLAAAIEAEQIYLKHRTRNEKGCRCFTGLSFDKRAAESAEGREALASAALKHRVPTAEMLSDVAEYCNQRKLASRHVKDAVDRLHMWVLLKNKEVLYSEARVLGLGPRFMSIYICKLSIERRIYYDDVDGLVVEWLEATSTLVLSYTPSRRHHRRGSPGKGRALEDVALVSNPCETVGPTSGPKGSELLIDPTVFPITLRLLSSIPVALHAIGGDDGPLDIGARLYLSSYFR